MISHFVRLNTRLCLEIQQRLPWRLTRSLFRLQDSMISWLMNEGGRECILDIGAGQLTPFALCRSPGTQAEILAVDIQLEQLEKNVNVDHRIVSDVSRSIPLKDGCVDVVVSRSVLEHLSDVPSVLRECHRVLRDSGVSVHLIPGKNAPFAVLNRILPHRVTRWMMKTLYAEFEGSWGFDAYYRQCSYPEITEALETAGFEVTRIEFRYYQSSYYRAFLPVYLFSLTYDLLVWLLGIKRLSSQILVVAEKRP